MTLRLMKGFIQNLEQRIAKKMINCPEPTELLDFSREHLNYEINMLFFSLEHVLRDQHREEPVPSFDGRMDLVSKHLAVEGVLAHLRVLFSFLSKDQTPESKTHTDFDDAFAIHFFDDPTVWKSKRIKLKKLGKVSHRIAKELAHLTYHRIGIPEKKKLWALGELGLEMLDCLKVFAENASPNRLHEEVKTTVKFWSDRYAINRPPEPKTMVSGSNSFTVGAAGATGPIRIP